MDNTQAYLDRKFGEILTKVCPEALRRQPNFRYYRHDGKRGSWKFCWTTERLPLHDNKYAAMIYKHDKKHRRWEMTKTLYFVKRKTAKARAVKWYHAKAIA